MKMDVNNDDGLFGFICMTIKISHDRDEDIDPLCCIGLKDLDFLSGNSPLKIKVNPDVLQDAFQSEQNEGAPSKVITFCSLKFNPDLQELEIGKFAEEASPFSNFLILLKSEDVEVKEITSSPMTDQIQVFTQVKIGEGKTIQEHILYVCRNLVNTNLKIVIDEEEMMIQFPWFRYIGGGVWVC